MQPRGRTASSTAYVVLGILMLALSMWFFSKGTEEIGRRDLPGWVLGCVGLFVAVTCAYIVWKRRTGSPSRLERR
jgi:LPXTG-motif cell wall-anchored protein